MARCRPWWTMSTSPPIPLHDWLAIPPAVRGDYLEVYRLAVNYGTGGRVQHAGAWETDRWRPWGLTRARVETVIRYGLAKRVGEHSEDLFVNFFDVHFEDAWKKSVESAPEGPKNRGKQGRPRSRGGSRPPAPDLRLDIGDGAFSAPNGTHTRPWNQGASAEDVAAIEAMALSGEDPLS